MDPLKNRVGAVVADVADRGAALLSAVWPRSMAKWEVERLERDGYRVGELCDVDFSLAFDGGAYDRGVADVALPAVKRAGFSVGDRARAERGFVTVRRRVRLRAYDLSRAAARLNRLVAPYGGSAAVIGPTAPPSPATAPVQLADRAPAAAEGRVA